MIIYAELVAKDTDPYNYTTYVFAVLDDKMIETIGSLYVMCVQFPNWEQDVINIGDRGYLRYKEVRAGIDEWFDGTAFNYYKYSNVIFEKFIKTQALDTREVFV